MKEYEGSVLIGVACSESIPTLAAASIMRLRLAEGDEGPVFIAATKGYVSRQMLVDRLMESDHQFLLLMDHDMIFEPDTLERLRAHKKPFVSGYYLRRQHAPMYSVWFHPFSGEWPHEPFLDDPERGRLHELGASGWGCMLVHRDVIEGTRRDILKGEPEIIEDDMDVWPYDLGAVLAGEESIAPLRVVKDDVVGSDIRFPFYAAAAGWKLYGDPDVRPKHLHNYPLSPDDFGSTSLQQQTAMKAQAVETIRANRERIRAAVQAAVPYRDTEVVAL